jgi:hypothetical protein
LLAGVFFGTSSIGGNSFEELFAAAAVRFHALAADQRAARDDLMAYPMRAQELATVTEARRRLAAEVRDLADRLDSRESDHSAVHDAWEVLVELAEQAESVRAEFFSRHPEQEAWLIEKRPWLDPKLQLIGKPSRSPGSRAARLRRKQKAAQISV